VRGVNYFNGPCSRTGIRFESRKVFRDELMKVQTDSEDMPQLYGRQTSSIRPSEKNAPYNRILMPSAVL
jgi:hypothetical protein